MESLSVLTALGFGQCPGDVHVSQPEGSIHANDFIPESTRKIHRAAFLWAPQGPFRKMTVLF